jgi:enamine deaminase RidA (YjgF/YER057c/UK114 family)
VTIERRNSPGLHPPERYHHITTVTGGRLVFLAGQCPARADDTVPEGLVAQVDELVANTLKVLHAAGAEPGDVVRTVVYVASSEQPDLVAVWRQLTGSALGAAFTTASTLVGVTCLAYPGQLVELDVTAALA